MGKLLGGLDEAAFMHRHWQRRPLLVRGAIPRFVDPLSRGEVLALSAEADAVSRLVRRRGSRWSLEHGPFPAATFRRLPCRDWTVLVQDTNHFSRAAARLLERFDFIPHARIDDLMVSFAVPGGGVGPHVDSYDVFLIQGSGRRRWQISGQSDRSFVPGLPLRILERFVPEQEWVLEAGDLLYLPPNVAHHGVAETPCLTWSVGFRAPSDGEIVAGFLDYLHERVHPAGHYADPGAPPARHAGEVPPRLLAHVSKALGRIRWGARDAREFTGRHLSEPKPHVYFVPPRRALGRERFVERARSRGLALDPRSRLLFSGTMFFLNGERVDVPPRARPATRRLADRRRLPPASAAPPAFWDLAYEWYTRGFAAPDDGGEQ